LKVIAIDADQEDITTYHAELEAYVDTIGVTFPVATELTGQGTYAEFSAIYEGSNPFPVNILIDKQGVIQYIAREYDSYTMGLLVQELLAAP